MEVEVVAVGEEVEMLTLKLYQNNPGPYGRMVIIETVGIWADHCAGGVKHIRAFKKTLGVMDEDGTPEFYVGGDPGNAPFDGHQKDDSAIVQGVGGNYFTWGVLENSQGKTTEIFR